MFHKNKIFFSISQVELINTIQNEMTKINYSTKDFLSKFQKVTEQINAIQTNTAEFARLKTEKNPIEQYVDGGLALLSNLITIYNKSDYERKRALIGSIFSGKLVVSKTECRTTETNMVIELFTRNYGQLEGIKKGTNSENSGLSPSVLRAGLEPARTLLFTGF